MIDVEIDIYNLVRNAIKVVNEKCEVSSRFYTSQPTVFPAASFIEISNVPIETSNDSSGDENVSSITFQLDVYSNLQSGARAECKKIISEVSDCLNKLNAHRYVCEPLSNIADNTITRVTARYIVYVDKNSVTYRR